MVVRHSLMGEQFHIHNPSILTEQLYLSAARALSSTVLLELGITTTVNATLELPNVTYRNMDCLRIAVEDKVASSIIGYFDMVADKIHEVHMNTGKILIYCRAGMSRSASLCIAYFIKYHGMNLEDAFNYVKARRPIIHPNVGFMRQLRDYERRLRHQPTKKKPDLKLVFAECCSCQEDYDDYEAVKVIKPRPQPRLPKVLISDPEESYRVKSVRTSPENPKMLLESGLMLPQASSYVDDSRIAKSPNYFAQYNPAHFQQECNHVHMGYSTSPNTTSPLSAALGPFSNEFKYTGEWVSDQEYKFATEHIVHVPVEELLDIPEDISDLKMKIMHQGRSAVVSIWLEVFESNVIRQRPIHAKISYQSDYLDWAHMSKVLTSKDFSKSTVNLKRSKSSAASHVRNADMFVRSRSLRKPKMQPDQLEYHEDEEGEEDIRSLKGFLNKAHHWLTPNGLKKDKLRQIRT